MIQPSDGPLARWARCVKADALDVETLTRTLLARRRRRHHRAMTVTRACKLLVAP